MTAYLGIALTAVVGIAGIVSTHLLARSQREGELARQAAERRERYGFAAYEARSVLYADFLAELRTLTTAARLRVVVAGGFRRTWGDGLAEKARRDADGAKDPEFAAQLRAFADALDDDPKLAIRLARDRHQESLPPAVEGSSVVQRVTELAARIAILGEGDAVKAARTAEREAVAMLLDLQSLEESDFDRPLDLEPLARATASMEQAAIYELRLLPFGDRPARTEGA